jgi:cytochrome c oxidase cbb3-type subunit 2
VAGRIHTSHRLILILAGGIYLILVLVTAILPAWRMHQTYGPPDGMPNPVVERGRRLYRDYGCWNCHTQQIRGDERKTSDEPAPVRVGERLSTRRVTPVLGADRRFGLDRASEPEDYAGDDPPFLGTQRTGPDLSVVGSRLPSAEWHYWHLYAPRALSPDSVMQGLPWLFKTEEADVVDKVDWEVEYIEALDIPSKRLWATPDAQALVEYLLSLKRREEVQR